MVVRLSSSVGEIAAPWDSFSEVNKWELSSSPAENISTDDSHYRMGCCEGKNTKSGSDLG